MITQMEKIHFRAEVTNTGTFCFSFLSRTIVCVRVHTPTRLNTRMPLLVFPEVRERGRERKTEIIFFYILEHLTYSCLLTEVT